MHLAPRYQLNDYRDQDQRQETSGWDHVRKGLGVFMTTTWVAWTAYNVYLIAELLSGWYAKKRAERGVHYKRGHVKRWDHDDPFVWTGR
jgi:hypothetical protein